MAARKERRIAATRDALRRGRPVKWRDLVALLEHEGFEMEARKGSMFAFYTEGMTFLLHRPHPGSELHAAAVREIRRRLKARGIL